MKGTAQFTHPLKEEEITEENYREVADHLFRCQLDYNIAYHGLILRYGWTDDDTDYMRTMFNASKTLMDIAYDGSRKDLIDFLFTPRRVYELMDPHSTFHEPLMTIDSAGGLCDQLMTYLESMYREEEEEEEN